MSPFGMRFLIKFNIKCFVLPSHITHVLQPFDISVASTLKNINMKVILSRLIQEFSKTETTAQMIRRQRVIALLNAWAKCTIPILVKSFKKAGLVLFNKDNLAMNKLILDPTTLIDTTVGLCLISPIKSYVTM